MTEKLYDENSGLFEFSANVISCEKAENGYAVVLDRTAFFPEAGGQPSDRGVLGGAVVNDVRIENEIIHYVSSPLKKGDAVYGCIDKERRIDFMQQHSAEHIVSGIVHKRFGYENVGFHLTEETVTLDFDGLLSDEQIAEVEQEANRLIRRNVRFSAYYPSEQQLAKLSYRSKKEIIGAVRIVEIEDTDCCACCAPHVGFASEIGVVHIEGLGKMRGGSRLLLKAGNRAVEDYRRISKALYKIGTMLSASRGDESAAVEQIMLSLEKQKHISAALEKKLVETVANCAADDTVVFADVSVEGIFKIAELMYYKKRMLCAAFAPIEGGYNFAFRDDEIQLAEFFEKFRSAFSVRGGGRGGMRRGSVVANEAALKNFFKKIKSEASKEKI